ncbi:DUF3667 domain-containing protein [Aliikangiella marina]|uniref:DUF3667 domain-containing protein n=1 Tax=Aliikangiella marina TaxID=1712262 RepID=UPI00163DB871|nr:DUF3667 domain-containing protein [Aliikangiella marina]
MVTSCKNCGNTLAGKFCSHCGQKNTVDRINFKYLSQQFTTDVLQFERGFLYTIASLFYRPGQVINDYINGKRAPYTKPFSYLVVIIAIYIYLSITFGFGTIMQDLLTGIQNGLTNEERESPSTIVSVLSWFNSHYIASVLVSVPFFALATRLAFYKSALNLYEHFVLNLYLSCQRMIIYAILGPLSLLWKGFEPIPVVFSLLYTIFAYFQIFNQFSLKRRTISILATYLIFTTLALLLLVSITVLHIEFLASD